MTIAVDMERKATKTNKTFYQFDKFNSTRAQMLDSIYHMTLGLL